MSAEVPHYYVVASESQPSQDDRTDSAIKLVVVVSGDEEVAMTEPDRQALPGAEVVAERARARFSPASCDGCGALFAPTRLWQRCCSARCRAVTSRRRREERRGDLLERLGPDDPGRPE